MISPDFLTTNPEFPFCPPCLYVKRCNSVKGGKELVLISFGENVLYWWASGSTFFPSFNYSKFLLAPKLHDN